MPICCPLYCNLTVAYPNVWIKVEKFFFFSGPWLNLFPSFSTNLVFLKSQCIAQLYRLILLPYLRGCCHLSRQLKRKKWHVVVSVCAGYSFWLVFLIMIVFCFSPRRQQNKEGRGRKRRLKRRVNGNHKTYDPESLR